MTTFERIARRDLWECWYCGVNLFGKSVSKCEVVLDHVTPRSKGGASTDDNLVLACWGCNCGKGGRTLEEFRITRQRQLGIHFTEIQLDYLESLGVKLPELPKFLFHREKENGC
jgi:hypothetical protein